MNRFYGYEGDSDVGGNYFEMFHGNFMSLIECGPSFMGFLSSLLRNCGIDVFGRFRELWTFSGF